MLEQTKYSTTMPDGYAIVQDYTHDLSLNGQDRNWSRRTDISFGPNVPFILEIAREATNSGNVERILIKAKQTLEADASSTIYPAGPYDIQAHMVIQFDRRYATVAQIDSVVAALLSFCIQRDLGTANTNVARVVRGEM